MREVPVGVCLVWRKEVVMVSLERKTVGVGLTPIASDISGDLGSLLLCLCAGVIRRGLRLLGVGIQKTLCIVAVRTLLLLGPINDLASLLLGSLLLGTKVV